MRFAGALPGWISVLLLVACVTALTLANGERDKTTEWLATMYFGQALAFSSFVAALVAANNIRHSGYWIAVLHVLLAAFGSLGLFLAASMIKQGLEEYLHHMAVGLSALLAALFIPIHAVAAAIGAARADQAGFSMLTKRSGLAGGLIALSGVIVIPLSAGSATLYTVGIVWLVVICLGLAGWWIGVSNAEIQKSQSAKKAPAS